MLGKGQEQSVRQTSLFFPTASTCCCALVKCVIMRLISTKRIKITHIFYARRAINPFVRHTKSTRNYLICVPLRDRCFAKIREYISRSTSINDCGPKINYIQYIIPYNIHIKRIRKLTIFAPKIKHLEAKTSKSTKHLIILLISKIQKSSYRFFYQ